MASKSELVFDRPIPGQSLTTTPGSFPYENPPQYPDEDSAMYYMLDKLSDKYVAPAIKHGLEKGMYASDLTNILLTKAFAQGKITPDVAALIAKRVMAGVVATGVAQGLSPKNIKYKKPSKREQELGELLAGGAGDDILEEGSTYDPSVPRASKELQGPLQPYGASSSDPINTERSRGLSDADKLRAMGINPRALTGEVEAGDQEILKRGPKGVMNDGE